MTNLRDIFFDLLREDEVEAAHEIETQGQLRQKVTPNPFLILVNAKGTLPMKQALLRPSGEDSSVPS